MFLTAGNSAAVCVALSAIFALTHGQMVDNPKLCIVATEKCNNGNGNAESNCAAWCEVKQTEGMTAQCRNLDEVDPDNTVDDPDLMVCVCNNNGTLTLSCAGDPHCWSADRNYWHPQPKVQMIAMENRLPTKQLPYFRLHSFQLPLGRVSIIRGLQFEIFGLTINIDSIRNDSWVYYRPAKVTVNGQELSPTQLPYVHKAFNKGKFEYVKITRTNNYYVNVFTNVGINFRLAYYYFNIWLLNSHIMKNVRGFMGTGIKDGIKTNDFVYPNGTSIPEWNYDQVLSWASDLPENQGPGKLGKIEKPKPLEDCQGPGVAAMKQMCKPYLLKKNQRNPFHRCLKANTELFTQHFDTCKMEVCNIITVDTKNEYKNYLEEFVCNYLQDIADDCGNLVPQSWASGTFCDKVPRTNPGQAFGHIKNNRG